MSHRRGPALPVLLVCVTILTAAAEAAAGTISISIAPGTSYEKGKLEAEVKISNSGDEAAHNVSAALRFNDQQVRGQPTQLLPAGGEMSSNVALDVGELGKGHYPYQVVVDYADANQYPFQAVHVGLLTVGAPLSAKVAVRDVQPGSFARAGTVTAVAKNLAGKEREAQVRIVAPDGIEVTDPVQTLQIPAWGEAKISAGLVNRTALAGSRLPVFAIIEYTDEDGHHAVISQGLMTILAPQSFYQENQTALWAAAGGIVLLWLGVVMWWLVRRSRGSRA